MPEPIQDHPATRTDAVAPPAAPHDGHVPSVALWASAFVLVGLILTQAGRWSVPAHAEMVASVGGYVVMTTEGSGEEILSVIDTRNEVLLMYAVVNQRELQLLERQRLPELFTSARAQAEGRN
ncbi:MAG: hypothetical protein EA378_06630 [Phycisphaerales bacterium]|nr:MAG: hypothetical protein EA378_06630 [Phycisphaerales bacterium]